MSELITKIGGRGFEGKVTTRQSLPQRKPHSAMTTQELVDKLQKKAAPKQKTLKQVVKELKK